MCEENLPNLFVTWTGLGGEALVPFYRTVALDDNEEAGAKASWLDEMFTASGGMPNSGALSGFSPNGNTLQAEIASAYFAIVHRDDHTLANKFINGYRLIDNLHPDYVARTKCYG